MSCGCLKGFLRVFEECLEGVLKVSGRYLKGIWRLLGGCLEKVLMVFQVRTNQVKSSQDRSYHVKNRSSQDRCRSHRST